MNLGKDFRKYALSEGISSLNLDYFEKDLTTGGLVTANMTPYILEERSLNVTQMDVFSRLMRDRILWVSGVVNDNMSNVVQAQLMYLDNIEKKDIKMHINTGGGSVLAGLGMIDVMRYINSDVETINTGMAASMGAMLLSSGTKGKRASLNFSKTMIHQVSSGASGTVMDNRINNMESEKYNFILFKMIAENTGKDVFDILEIANRDKWFNSKEALEFGLIDEVIIRENETSIDKYMEGFDEYYSKYVKS